jgi:hypothetical protein
MLYGCAEDTMSRVDDYLQMGVKRGPAMHHPLILPVIFAELERKRMLNQVDLRGGELMQRVMDLKNQLREEDDEGRFHMGSFDVSEATKSGIHQGRWRFWWGGKGRSGHGGGDGDDGGDGNGVSSTGVKECKATELWIEVSSLRNGLESFRAQLKGMLEHARWLSQTRLLAQSGDSGCDDSGRPRPLAKSIETGKRAEARLEEMMAELDCKIRSSQSVLDGMVMTTQVVSVSDLVPAVVAPGDSLVLTTHPGVELPLEERRKSHNLHCEENKAGQQPDEDNSPPRHGLSTRNFCRGMCISTNKYFRRRPEVIRHRARARQC